MIRYEDLKEASKKVEKENWIFRSFLKEQDSEKLDGIVHKLHDELFKHMDCVSCCNCCRKVSPALNQEDIDRISKHLKISEEEFKSRYLEVDEGGDLLIKQKPCSFLCKEGCSIYDIRPDDCKRFPYTDKPEFWTRLINMVELCSVCPVVFEIFERLKDIYGEEFEKYKSQYPDNWI